MTTPRTSNGRTITDAEIEALADEAERGYDPAELIARRGKRGRPTSAAPDHQPSNLSASTPSSTTRSQHAPNATV